MPYHGSEHERRNTERRLRRIDRRAKVTRTVKGHLAVFDHWCKGMRWRNVFVLEQPR